LRRPRLLLSFDNRCIKLVLRPVVLPHFGHQKWELIKVNYWLMWTVKETRWGQANVNVLRILKIVFKVFAYF
jgi:hypothetical protein